MIVRWLCPYVYQVRSRTWKTEVGASDRAGNGTTQTSSTYLITHSIIQSTRIRFVLKAPPERMYMNSPTRIAAIEGRYHRKLQP